MLLDSGNRTWPFRSNVTKLFPSAPAVHRAAKVGDTIRMTVARFGQPEGALGTVVDVSDGGCRAMMFTKGRGYRQDLLLNSGQFEVTTPYVPTVGTKVVMIAKCPYSTAEVGAAGEVVSVDERDSDQPIRVLFTGGYREWPKAGTFRPVFEPTPADAPEPPPKSEDAHLVFLRKRVEGLKATRNGIMSHIHWSAEVADARRSGESRPDYCSVYGDMYRLIENAEKAVKAREAELAKPDLSAFMAPCPDGYGTVLGHLSLQGKQPEDVGMAEGRRLAAIAKREGTAAIWVRSSEALREVCDRVRAYLADFLARHLGPAPSPAR